MCDTIVAVPGATKDGAMLFGKNSDRESDEVQNLVIFPRQTFEAKTTVECTHITIPQVSHTNRVLLSQPFWMFGAEMGSNEHGVVIGNEAIMTRVKPSKIGLTGMDLIRLALERCDSAKNALETIITLLETHGQGGQCGYRDNLYYMNSFIIADKKQAFVLETVEKNWAWKKITDVWSISNKISLEHDYDAASPGLIDYAIKKGWCTSEADFNFSKHYSDKIITWGAAGKAREQANRCHLAAKIGELTTTDFMQFLRFHSDNPKWKPSNGLRLVVCAHAGNNLTKPSQSVQSLVASIRDDRALYYATGSSNPCMSPYFPIFAENTELPEDYYPGKENFDPAAFWWKAEQFHRQVIFKYLATMEIIKPEIDAYEQEMIQKIEVGSVTQKMIDEHFQKVVNLIAKWSEKLPQIAETNESPFYKRFWKKYNQLNMMP